MLHIAADYSNECAAAMNRIVNGRILLRLHNVGTLAKIKVAFRIATKKYWLLKVIHGHGRLFTGHSRGWALNWKQKTRVGARSEESCTVLTVHLRFKGCHAVRQEGRRGDEGVRGKRSEWH